MANGCVISLYKRCVDGLAHLGSLQDLLDLLVIAKYHLAGDAGQSVLLILFDHLGIQKLSGWDQSWVRRSAWTRLSRRVGVMAIDQQQSPGILVELIGGEQVRDPSGPAFDLSKKGHRMGRGPFTDYVGEDNFVSRAEGDPNPGVSKGCLKLFDGLQVAFLFADKGPHLVELAFGDNQN